LARALIVGCGCRGRALGGRLAGEGLAVRGTSRRETGLAAIEAAGFEAALADPDRPGTVLELVGDVALVVWLLGSAVGGREAVAAIHGPRLESLLGKLVDTPVRGFAYEPAGRVERGRLEAGAQIVEAASATWHIPVAVLAQAPGADWDAWSRSTSEQVLALLG
jgi:hypothetical protein